MGGPHKSTGNASERAKLTELEDTLLHECNKIAEKYKVYRPNLSGIVAAVASSTNLCCIIDAICNRTSEKIDPYYLSRHVLAVNLIVEALYDRLSTLQFKVGVGTDVHGKLGILDILLGPIRCTVEPCNNDHRIGIEVKTGLSMDFAQLFRYLMDVDTLILVRTLPKQVVALRQSDLVEPLSAVLSAWISRIRRLLSDDIPICPHKKQHMQPYFLNSHAIELDILTFAKNLCDVCSPLQERVVVELKRFEQCITEVSGHDVG